MSPELQNGVALLLAGACAVYLLRAALAKWRRIFSPDAKGCGGCGTCGTKAGEHEGKAKPAEFVSLWKGRKGNGSRSSSEGDGGGGFRDGGRHLRCPPL